MQWLKFLSLLCLITPVFSYESFTDNQCLDDQYEVSLKKASLPFGLLPNTFKIVKKKCLLELSYKKYSYFESLWKVDVCRRPVHIKSGKNVDVVYVSECNQDLGPNDTTPQFCQIYKELKTVFEKTALIFAEGEKEDLASEHGKVYCSYRLLEKYLLDKIIFNRNVKYADVLVPKSSRSTDNLSEKKAAPIKNEVKVEQRDLKPKVEESIEGQTVTSDPLVREI